MKTKDEATDNKEVKKVAKKEPAKKATKKSTKKASSKEASNVEKVEDKETSKMTEVNNAKLDESIAKLLGDRKVIRFTRYQLGEGIEKKKEDFAEEVRKQAGL